MEIIAALTLGLMGSLHCLGMCGPIALAIPFSQKPLTRLTGILLYNTGRIITYALMGAVFGLFGKGLALAGFQQIVSIVLGSVMILGLIFPFLFKKIKPLEKIMNPINTLVKEKLSRLLRGDAYGNLLLTGILNGLLPCGLVYLAVAGAIASGGILNGTIFMALFGLGTIPMMAVLPMLGSLGGLKFRLVYRKILPVFVFTLGVLFILRGMNLGIKYVSPKLQGKVNMEQHSCH